MDVASAVRRRRPDKADKIVIARAPMTTNEAKLRRLSLVKARYRGRARS
jgi:hypothetical protein